MTQKLSLTLAGLPRASIADMQQIITCLSSHVRPLLHEGQNSIHRQTDQPMPAICRSPLPGRLRLDWFRELRNRGLTPRLQA